MTPTQAIEKKNKVNVWRKLYADYVSAKLKKRKFKVGDKSQ